MAMIEINLRPSRRELRQFGWIALVGFGVLGALIYWRIVPVAGVLGESTSPVAYVLWVLAGISALLSVVAPAANRPLFVGMILVTFPIGFVLSYVLMGAFFYGLLTPLGWAFRLMGRDALRRRFDSEATTYWIPHRPVSSTRRYFNQY